MTGVDRALVLGGGGPVGIAWEAGVAAGLEAEGVRLGEADRIIGTSAGSFVGAQLASGRSAGSLFDAQIALGEKDAEERAAGKPASSERMPKPDLTPLMALFMKPMGEGQTQTDRLREFGGLALATETITEQAFIEGFGRALADQPWPERFACTAVDAHSGEFRLWDQAAGAPLAAGVASSCSVPGIFPPITIEGRRFIDGGVRSATSIDLAKGAKRVVALAVVGRMGRDFQMSRIEAELTGLEPEGAGLLIVPDDASLDVFGVNLMEAKDRAGIARAGYEQGKREAVRVREFWA